MNAVRFDEFPGNDTHGLRRLAAPFRRLLYRLLLPAFQRQAELFGQQAERLEESRAEVARLGAELAATRGELARACNELSHARCAAVRHYLDKHDHIYLGAGGLGDAWLTIASYLQESRGHVLFAANWGVGPLVERLFQLFDTPVLVVPHFDSSAAGRALYEQVCTHAHFAGQGYLPDGLDWTDWGRRPQHYFSRVTTRLPQLIARLGRAANLRPTARMIAVAPRASDLRSDSEQRYLAVPEYRQLVAGFLDDQCTVVTLGSEQDLDYYGLYEHPNHIWMSADWSLCSSQGRAASDLRQMLAVINGCAQVVSVDTWLKTYAALAGIPTTVIATRRKKPGINFGDHIFLNPAWGFRVATVEELLAPDSALARHAA